MVKGAKLSPGQVVRARKLRQTETDAERKLWNALRGRRLTDAKFVRQLAIGPYVADFVCREAMLVVELDGGQHAGAIADRKRTALLNARGYAVLRFWNNEVLLNMSGCLEAIAAVLGGDPSPGVRFAPATLSPEGRGSDDRAVSAHPLEASGDNPGFAALSPRPSGERDRVRGAKLSVSDVAGHPLPCDRRGEYRGMTHARR